MNTILLIAIIGALAYGAYLLLGLIRSQSFIDLLAGTLVGLVFFAILKLVYDVKEADSHG